MPRTLRAQALDLRIPVGTIAGHAVGRAVVASDQTIELLAYCPFLAGLSTSGISLFSSGNTEKGAYFSLRSSRFRVEPIQNGRVFYTRIVPVGADFLTSRITYHPSPNLDFNRPETFSSGQTVITLRNRGGSIILVQDATITYTSTAEVLATEDFTFQGRQLNLKDTGVSTFTVTLSGPAPSLEDLLGASGSFSIPVAGSIVAAAARE
ncbi:MAG: hypothetical protein FJW39_31370 [Acidobacteria bacterium]|nr:hypothetical protein [Acidobacteriota bacterium]